MSTFDSRTPQGRAAQLQALETDRIRAERRRDDLRHQPGSPESDLLEQADYWAGRLEAAEHEFEVADAWFRELRGAYGRHPTDAEAAEVRLAGQALDLLAGECSNYRALEKYAREEHRAVRGDIGGGWY